jgi:hypothetical protein
MLRIAIGLGLALSGLAATEVLGAPSLRGSPAAMQQQNREARQQGLAFYRTPAQIRQGVADGSLARLGGNADYEVADFVSYPYLHPAAHLFVERLAAQYREACGQKLVVTSAVRPANGQPSNSHALSVHPAGMAVDLRVSDRASCRSWLESAILNLEAQGVLNGIREFRPPHYHIAVFPRQYMEHAEERMAVEEAALAEAREAERQKISDAAMRMVAVATGADFLMPAERDGKASERRSSTPPFAIALAAVLVALPFGLTAVLRRRRRD